jgi:hypothetical protein
MFSLCGKVRYVKSYCFANSTKFKARLADCSFISLACYVLSPRRFLLEKLIVTHLVKKNSPPLMKPESSLPYSEESATGTCLESHESNPHLSTLFPSHPFCFTPIYVCFFRVVSYTQVFLPKSCMHFLFLHCTPRCPAHVILLDLLTLIMFGEVYKLRKNSSFKIRRII